ncbi:MAG: DNA-binding protein [Deltaproteobacteria bacterium]|jgi:excisionase family DNA binding protein|nr:MAG: DNA-binding protein [Deltaproteobacteria bacterium]
MSELFYSTSEVADLFGINRVTIYRWVKEGKVKAYKIGKHIKIPVSEVERLGREFGLPEMIFPGSLELKQKE